MSTFVDKPWGQEIIFTTPDLPYTSKLIFIKAGRRLSLQYHELKTETLTLVNGSARILTGTDKDHLTISLMEPNLGYTIPPQELHRVEAITDATIIEASTPEKGTTVRVEDDYHRPNETK
ncbi:cupin [Patescibacteria group bacterium]|nr:cupin [Patescibacteria group bacterium]